MTYNCANTITESQKNAIKNVQWIIENIIMIVIKLIKIWH